MSEKDAACKNCGHGRNGHIDKWGGICVGCPCPGFEPVNAAESLPAEPVHELGRVRFERIEGELASGLAISNDDANWMLDHADVAPVPQKQEAEDLLGSMVRDFTEVLRHNAKSEVRRRIVEYAQLFALQPSDQPTQKEAQGLPEYQIEEIWERHCELIEVIECDMRGDKNLMGKRDFYAAAKEVVEAYRKAKVDD